MNPAIDGNCVVTKEVSVVGCNRGSCLVSKWRANMLDSDPGAKVERFESGYSVELVGGCSVEQIEGQVYVIIREPVKMNGVSSLHGVPRSLSLDDSIQDSRIDNMNKVF